MLDNPRSPRVRAVAKLAKRGARSETGLFLLEGPQAVAEALTFRPELVVELYATPTALERYTDIAQTAVDAGVDVEFVSEHVLETMADTVTPQGFVAVCHQFPTSIRDILSGEPKLVAILEEVRDPGNAGTIIRAADSAGADAVILTGRTVDLYNPKVVRSSTGLDLPRAGRRRGDPGGRASAGRTRRGCRSSRPTSRATISWRCARRACSPGRPRGCSATRRAGSAMTIWPSRIAR